MKTEVLSMSVPTEVAEAIRRRAAEEDRSVSKVAGRILLRGFLAAPEPQVKFARRAVKPEGKK